MGNDPISVRFQPTAEDYRRVLIWYQWKRISLVLGITLIIVFSFLFFLYNAKPRAAKNDNRQTGYVVFILVPFFVVGASYWGIRRQAKKIESISELTKFSFSEEGIEAESTSSTVTAKWERFNKIVETSKDMIFFPQENVFYVVPKRVFESDEQLTRVRTLIKAGLGRRAKLR